MTEPSATNTPTPSVKSLMKTLIATLVAAGVVLVLFVLPAEYEIDPTGVGSALGLVHMGEDDDHDDHDDHGGHGEREGHEGLAISDDAMVADEPHKQETFTIAIGPYEEIEYKIGMVEGSAVLFSWTLDNGTLYSDLHAEPYNDLDHEPIRYSERDDVASGYGAIRAPYSGFHGWYWRNDSDEPIEVTLEVTGFFTHAKELLRSTISGAPSS